MPVEIVTPRDGSKVLVWPVESGDKELLRAGFERLGLSLALPALSCVPGAHQR